METGRASAIAHPIQGLVKYHGLRDFEQRIPFHPSISVCTAPTHAHSTVSVLDGGDDRVEIDGKVADARAAQRVRTVVDVIRKAAGDSRPFSLVSRNDFPAGIGLGSSASGFAALAVAAAAAYGLERTPEQLSAVARLGAGSASRAVTGYFSEWVPPPPGGSADRSVSKRMAGARRIDMRIVVPIVMADEPTEGVHKAVLTSPFFDARLKYIDAALMRMRIAVAAGDIAEIGRTAERDTLNLHAITMTADPPRLTWRPQTVAAMRRVWELREQEDVPCWFSIDTGATPYVNTTPAAEDRVVGALKDLPGVDEVLRLRVGKEAHLVDRHLA